MEMIITYRVREERSKRKWNLDKLSSLSGVGSATLSCIENGIGNPTIETICLIGMALEVDPETLFTVTYK